jgi:hypothetical protein
MTQRISYREQPAGLSVPSLGAFACITEPPPRESENRGFALDGLGAEAYNSRQFAGQVAQG